MLEEKLKHIVRDVHDFPKPGIVFKDITPLLQDAQLCTEMVDAFVEKLKDCQLDAVAGIESRGFYLD